MKVLLEAGADPNQQSCNFEEHYSFQESPLFTAVDYLDLELLSLLLNAAADPNKYYNQYDIPPLFRAVQNYGEADDEHKDLAKTSSVISLLLSHKANPGSVRELAQVYDAKEILILFDKKTTA